MSLSNDAQAGPSTINKIMSTKSMKDPLIPQSTQQPSLELAEKVQIYKSTCLENTLDYSINVSNSISMARDQLANERNWLTWFRISCTLIILGFTILIRFRLPDGTKKDTVVDQSNQPIGYTFVAIGFLCFFLGIGKYFKNQSMLIKQATYIQAGWGSFIIIAILFLFVCTVLILASINTSSAFNAT